MGDRTEARCQRGRGRDRRHTTRGPAGSPDKKLAALHGVMKTDLAGGRLPSGLFGANAAWWGHVVLAFNLHAALRRLGLGPEWAGRRMKAVRFSLLGLPGRVVRHARRLVIQLGSGHPSYEPLVDARRTIVALAHGPP